MKQDYTDVQNIYIICGKTDMRKGIDGLATLIQDSFELDPYGDSIFLFSGWSKDRYNNGYDFYDYVTAYPFEDVACVHVSGFEVDNNGVLHDTHAKDLGNDILNATKQVIDKISPKYVLLERDFNVNTAEDALRDIKRIREVLTINS